MAVAVAGKVVESQAAPAGVTLVEHFWRNVAERGPLPAMHAYAGSKGRWSTITWADFGADVRAVAAFLVGEGVEAADHVAIWSENRPEWHVADMATLCVRACPAPVYSSLSAEEAAYVVGHSDSVVAFVDGGARLERLLSVRDRLPRLRRVVVFDAAEALPGDGFVITWGDALARGRAGALDEVDRRIAAVAPEDVATLIYTSGTTGPPKAVMLTHRNVDAAVFSFTSVIPVTPDDRVLSYLPLAHIAERISSEFRQYIFGNAVHFAAGITTVPEHLVDIRPTFFVGVPRVWEKFAQKAEAGIAEQPRLRRMVARWALVEGMRSVDRRQRGEEEKGFAAWRHRLADRLVLRTVRAAMGLDRATVLVSAAAPISPEVLRFLHALGLEVCEHYGMSEDCAVTSINPIGRVRLGTVGPPMPGVDVRIAEDGEILVRCESNFLGYFKDDEATRATIIDGWLHTGDVGDFDEAGYLRITDRKKDLIITAGGKNISPSNIEIALETSPLVGKAVVIGDRRPYVSALLTLDMEAAEEFARRAGIKVTAAELATNPQIRAELQRHVDSVNRGLARVEQVKRWQLLASEFRVGTELTPTFKVKRKVVATMYAGPIEENYR